LLFNRLWSLAGTVDRGEEAVAPASHGGYEPGILGGVAQRIPEPADGGVEAMVEVDEGVCRPEPFAHLLASDYLAGTIEQHCENLEWLFLEPNFGAVAE
jgi:hypothetical protein